jgi:hypothetical protein
MAKNKNQTSSTRHHAFYKHPLFYLLIIFLVISALLIITRRAKEPTLTDSTTSNTSGIEKPIATNDAIVASTSTPTESSSSVTDQSISPDGKTPEKYEGTDPNTSESLTGYITTARFDNNKLIIRVNIDQYISSGTCTLILSDGSNQLEKTSKLVPVASTSTCEGFDIQASELYSFDRPIEISIRLASNDKFGSITGRVE